MNKSLWILLLTAITATITDGQYTNADIHRIVVQHVMDFWNFPTQDRLQYGVLMLLPPAGNPIALQPAPGNRDQNGDYTYNHQLIRGDMIVGTNYAAARPSRGIHTERLLLGQLTPLMATYFRAFGQQPAAILLYTRGTPCTGCTGDIAFARNAYPWHQIVVAYSTEMVNDYMDPIVNCKNRNYLRAYVQVICVKEQYRNGYIKANQCTTNDNTPQCYPNHG